MTLRQAPAAAAGPVPVPMATRVAVLAALFMATCAAFAGVLRNGWVYYDDGNYVFENAVVARGLSWRSVLWFLHEQHGANWVPVTAISHMLDVQLYGLAPAGHHATSLVLHALDAVLVALVLHRMTGAWWRSVFVAAFFALHPLRVESVAWIAERKDVLSAFFFLLALGAYTRWVERPGRARYALVAVAYGLGLLSKPMLITFPFLLVVLDVWPLGRLAAPVTAPAGAARRPAPAAPAGPRRRPLAALVAEKWPLFAMAAVSTVVTFSIQQQTGALANNEWVPFWRRLLSAPVTCWRYVGMTLWPHRLAVLHPYTADPHAGRAAVAVVALVVVTVIAWSQARRWPWFVTGWLWYIGLLVPVIGLIQTGQHAYADRFTLLPGLGLGIAIVWSAAELVGSSRTGRVALVTAALALLAVCGVATARQVGVWRNTTTLFTRVLQVEGGNPVGAHVGHRMVGWGLLGEGRVAEAKPHLEFDLGLAPGYEDSLRRVLAVTPDSIETRRALATTLARETRDREAIREYRAILARDPDDIDALNNIAWMLATHALASHRDGREAVRLAERARDLCPEPVAVVYSTLAAAYAEAGRFADAIAAGTRAVALARVAGHADDAARFAQQLARYRSGRPFRFET